MVLTEKAELSNTNKVIAQLNAENTDSGLINCIRFSPHGLILASCSDLSAVTFWTPYLSQGATRNNMHIYFAKHCNWKNTVTIKIEDPSLDHSVPDSSVELVWGENSHELYCCNRYFTMKLMLPSFPHLLSSPSILNLHQMPLSLSLIHPSLHAPLSMVVLYT